jgi:hypothetical protein
LACAATASVIHLSSKKESFALFQAMKDRFDEEMVHLWRVRPVVTEEGVLPRPSGRPHGVHRP